MSRPRTGQLVVNQTSRGKTFAVRFPHRGERYFVWLGAEWEGWTEDKAIAEQRKHIARLKCKGGNASHAEDLLETMLDVRAHHQDIYNQLLHALLTVTIRPAIAY